MMEERLNKVLGELGICSRREADRLIQSGQVLVDGEKARTGQKVGTDQEIVCQGRLVRKRGQESLEARENRPSPVLLAVNKPRGVVCTSSRKDRAPNITDMVNYPDRVYHVGRLDKDSEGLVLMTNQGDLVNKIMRSGNAHEKEYLVEIDRPVTKAFLKKMASGIWLKELNRKTLPCRIRQTGEKSFCIILVQGLNRQIRRMCAACGCQVLSLKRVRIMNLQLGSLKPGQWRKVEGREYREFLGLLRDSTSRPFAEANTKSREAEPWTRE